MVVRLDVRNSQELQAVLLAVRAADRTIQARIRKHTKELALPEWQQAMAQHAPDRLSHRVLVSTARLSASNQNIRLSAATVGRKLKGGLQPKLDYPAVEFGADREKRTTYTAQSRRGRSYTVRNRATTRQLRPRNKTGYTFYPAVAGMVPRIASLWVQTVVRTMAEAFEGKTD